MLTIGLLGIIYASIVSEDESAGDRLDVAVSNFLETLNAADSVIWSLSYCTSGPAADAATIPQTISNLSPNVLLFPPRPHDIALDDTILTTVQEAWETVLGPDEVAESTFLRFEERESEVEN